MGLFDRIDRVITFLKGELGLPNVPVLAMFLDSLREVDFLRQCVGVDD